MAEHATSDELDRCVSQVEAMGMLRMNPVSEQAWDEVANSIAVTVNELRRLQAVNAELLEACQAQQALIKGFCEYMLDSMTPETRREFGRQLIARADTQHPKTEAAISRATGGDDAATTG